MLKLKNVRWTSEDGTTVLNGINLDIEAGKLTVVTGPNGSGKTTLAKVIAGIYEQTEGEMTLDGEDITHMGITERAKHGIAYAFQQPVRFKGITVRKLLNLAGEKDLEKDEICKYMQKVGLCTKNYIDRYINDNLSGGEIKRIEIASVLARSNSKVMVFDEPEAGIDLWSFNGLIDAFEELKKTEHKALLVISHQERLLEIADEIVVIANGKVRLKGNAKEIFPLLLEDEKSGACPLGNASKED